MQNYDYLRVLSRYRLRNSAIFGTFDANGKNLRTLAEPSRIIQRAFLRVQRRSDLRTQRQLLRGCLTPTRHLPTFRRRRAYAPACLSEAASVNVLVFTRASDFCRLRQRRSPNQRYQPQYPASAIVRTTASRCRAVVPYKT